MISGTIVPLHSTRSLASPYHPVSCIPVLLWSYLTKQFINNTAAIRMRSCWVSVLGAPQLGYTSFFNATANPCFVHRYKWASFSSSSAIVLWLLLPRTSHVNWCRAQPNVSFRWTSIWCKRSEHRSDSTGSVVCRPFFTIRPTPLMTTYFSSSWYISFT